MVVFYLYINFVNCICIILHSSKSLVITFVETSTINIVYCMVSSRKNNGDQHTALGHGVPVFFIIIALHIYNIDI